MISIKINTYKCFNLIISYLVTNNDLFIVHPNCAKLNSVFYMYIYISYHPTVISGNAKMTPLKDNQDVASFLVTKHSWKGRYKRVFSVGTHGITTYNPDRLEVTNKWLYADVVTVASAKHSNSAANHDFMLVMTKNKKVDTMKFSSEHKCLILTEAFKYRHLFAEKKEVLVSNNFQ